MDEIDKLYNIDKKIIEQLQADNPITLHRLESPMLLFGVALVTFMSFNNTVPEE